MDSLDDLLIKTSRTFALAIPYLPEPLRRQVSLAYLLFRIADTIEDSVKLPVREKTALLLEFAACIRHRELAGLERLAAHLALQAPSGRTAENELASRSVEVVEAVSRLLDSHAASAIFRHVERTARGMSEFVPLVRELPDLASLHRYCYVVAGIVGEMLTDLFLLHHADGSEFLPALSARAAAFGEGLQLVNILKDANSDASEGRRFLPRGVPIAEVFAFARNNLDSADRYVEALRAGSFPPGVIQFTSLPVCLARETLDRVERTGAGSKLTRPETFAICRELERAYP